MPCEGLVWTVLIWPGKITLGFILIISNVENWSVLPYLLLGLHRVPVKYRFKHNRIASDA